MKLADERRRLEEEANGILAQAEHADRDLTEAEQRDWDRLDAQVDMLNDLERRSQQESRRSRGTLAGGREGIDGQPPPGKAAARSDTWVNAETGREVRMLRSGDSMYGSRSWPDVNGVKARDLDMGRALAGLLTGDWRGRQAERRALDLTPTGGGVLIPDVLAAKFVDVVRPRIVTQAAGAVQFSMDGSEVTIAKMTGDFSPTWRAPNVPIAESTPTFGAVVLKARTLGCWFRVPREMAQDAQNLPQVLVESLSVAMATEIDRVALVGQAAKEEPLGLLSAGIGTTAGGGALIDWSKFVSAAGAILTANGPDAAELAMIIPPRTWIVLQNLQDTLHQPLRMPDAVAAMKRFATMACPINLGAGTNEAFCCVGDFSQMLQGVRMPLMIEVSNIGGGDTSTNVFTSHQQAVKLTFRGDVAVARPAFFNQLTGVTS